MTDAELMKENDILRALVSKLNIPCVHCGIPDISKCSRGFPGCVQADDIMVGESEYGFALLDRLRKAESRVTQLESLLISSWSVGTVTLHVSHAIPFGSEPKYLGDIVRAET